MKLHEAIERLIQNIGQALNAREISDLLNANQWYKKADGSLISPSQITARVNKYPMRFAIDKVQKPMLIGIPDMQKLVGGRTKSPATTKRGPTTGPPVPAKIKASFPPLVDTNSRVLILGTLPGDESLLKKEYYGNLRNRFWKVIAGLADLEELSDYQSKKAALLALGIGIWDVVDSAERSGSLDSAIRIERVNDLDTFIETHPQISIVAFNGRKAQLFYDRYFKRKAHLQYVCLPSTSPANASWNVQRLQSIWKALLHLQ